MFCSKIGGECPHPVGLDEKLVFVMMPFEDSASTYDAVQQAVEGVDGKSFRCDRSSPN